MWGGRRGRGGAGEGRRGTVPATGGRAGRRRVRGGGAGGLTRSKPELSPSFPFAEATVAQRRVRASDLRRRGIAGRAVVWPCSEGDSGRTSNARGSAPSAPPSGPSTGEKGITVSDATSRPWNGHSRRRPGAGGPPGRVGGSAQQCPLPNSRVHLAAQTVSQRVVTRRFLPPRPELAGSDRWRGHNGARFLCLGGARGGSLPMLETQRAAAVPARAILSCCAEGSARNGRVVQAKSRPVPAAGWKLSAARGSRSRGTPRESRSARRPRRR